MKYLVCLLFLSGCVPTHLDASISFGENQKIERNLKVSHLEDPEEPEEKLIEEGQSTLPSNQF